MDKVGVAEVSGLSLCKAQHAATSLSNIRSERSGTFKTRTFLRDRNARANIGNIHQPLCFELCNALNIRQCAANIAFRKNARHLEIGNFERINVCNPFYCIQKSTMQVLSPVQLFEQGNLDQIVFSPRQVHNL
jgi:hypothetical protein